MNEDANDMLSTYYLFTSGTALKIQMTITKRENSSFENIVAYWRMIY